MTADAVFGIFAVQRKRLNSSFHPAHVAANYASIVLAARPSETPSIELGYQPSERDESIFTIPAIGGHRGIAVAYY
jgi:hypothetical protein